LQAFAQLGKEFEPLLIGCQENRRNWEITAGKRQTEKIERREYSSAPAERSWNTK